MKKGKVFVVLGLLTASLLPLSSVLAQETAATAQQAVKSQDEVAAEIMARKGKIFQIDVTGAGEGFDIYPRGKDVILRPNRVQFYPHGLIHIYFGSLKLTSNETPIWFHDWMIEWVDTEAKPGEKGYEIKFESQDGDLFKGVTFTTSGFSFTADAVKIKEDGDKVIVSVID